jgi:hypothetical protein
VTQPLLWGKLTYSNTRQKLIEFILKCNLRGLVYSAQLFVYHGSRVFCFDGELYERCKDPSGALKVFWIFTPWKACR